MRPSPARTVESVLVLFTAIWSIFAVTHLIQGRPGIGAFVGLLAAVHAVARLAVSRDPDRLEVIGSALLALNVAGILTLSWISGQARSGWLWLLVVVPLLAGASFPQRGLYPWSTGVAFALCAMWVGQSWHPVAPLYEVTGTELLANQLAIIVVISWAFQELRERLAASAEAQNERERALSQQKLAAQNRALDLARARRELEDALRAREAFLAQMSHEVRTPLNGILGLAQLMADRDSNLSREEVARDISAAGKSLLGLLNNILDVSKMRSGAFEIANRPFDFHELVESTVQVFSGDAWAKGVDLVYVFGPEVPVRAVADPVRLQQVLNNLVGNALRHTAAGAVVVQASFDADRGTLELRVVDSGPGVPDEDKAKVFRPFEHATGSLGQKVGSGLGLSLVREIVTRMGGIVWVQDAPGGSGAEFGVQIPVESAAGRYVDDRDSLPPRVLVVLDNPRILRSITCRLERARIEPLVPECDQVMDVWIGGDWDVALVDLETAERLGLPDVARPKLSVQGAPTGDLSDTLELTGRVLSPVRSRSLFAALRAAFLDQEAQGELWSAEAKRGASGQVLVAEDDPTSQRVMELLLTRMGFEPVIVGTGEEAIQRARAHAFHTVILDREMPVLDGMQAAREIRTLLPDARIAMVTASFTAEQKLALADIGVHDLIQKPVHLAELIVLFERGETSEDSPAVVVQAPFDPPTCPEMVEALDVLRDMLGGPVELALAIEEWSEWSEEKLCDASRGIANGDAGPLREAAHAVAGNCSRFGGETLERDARSLMRRCIDDPDRALEEGVAFVGRVREFLRRLEEIAERGPQPSHRAR